jgi:tRNA uridine 5-carboxymethylaminomethyl modification enzyme
MATEVLIGKNDSVEGVRTFFGMDFYAPSVVLTTGTFMSGKIWVGRTSMPAGRAGESASHGLTENLQLLGFETDRLKTGTPPRIDRRTVDFSGLEPQHGDEEVYSTQQNFPTYIDKCRFNNAIAFHCYLFYSFFLHCIFAC